VAYNTFDISSRKQAEVSLLEMKLQLETIITSARDAIVITDEANRIILTNDAARTMFGYPEEALLHQPIQRFIPANDVRAPFPARLAIRVRKSRPGPTRAPCGSPESMPTATRSRSKHPFRPPKQWASSTARSFCTTFRSASRPNSRKSNSTRN
jgi:PAS domain-containing protein